MTAQSLSWAKSILDTLFYKNNEPITANLHNTEQVCSLLADEQSRHAYIQELAYKALLHTLGRGQIACQLTGGLPPETFHADCMRAMKDDSLPKTAVATPSHTLWQGYVCSFYYRQYEYRKFS